MFLFCFVYLMLNIEFFVGFLYESFIRCILQIVSSLWLVFYFSDNVFYKAEVLNLN